MLELFNFRKSLYLNEEGYKKPNYKRVARVFNEWNEYNFDSGMSDIYTRFFEKTKPYLDGIKTVHDFGCGTGNSGKPFIKHGLIVDGSDIALKRMIEAKSKGYSNLEYGNVVEGFVPEKHDLSISVGVIGEYVTWMDMLNSMTQTSSLIAFTAMVESVDSSLDDFLETETELLVKDVEVGWIHRDIQTKDYFFVVARTKI